MFDKCYLHSRVYQEVKWPDEVVVRLNDLIEKQQIILVNDEELLTKIEIREYFLATLEEVCEVFGVDYYEQYYDELRDSNSNEELLNAVEIIDNQLKDIGEIKTLHMIILLRDIANKQINYFLSDDRRARRAIVLTFGKTIYDDKITGLSVLGSFDLLKENGLAKVNALEYIKKFSFTKTKVYDQKRNMIKLENNIIIEKLYAGRLKRLITGDFILK
ncbi:hypothetical protein MWH28_02745 [Natroniella sulfidigena]|uniref:hypothetical protein n=1 Tax=Natroniella sulfidigena TaxID=723921 RepID=UPI00200A7F8F|nr:hypothetical protein [Natroniella sulfidigena]MCK8816280.1 hypothetical protein [Natroniella sulfidigena]